MKARFPHPGEVFEDKYRVEAILGSGGFARVYRAVETGLDRKVALKILRPRIDDEQSDSQRDSYLETVMSRFKQEARLLSQLRSPNTITMHHYGKTEDGLLYMVLEYIDGLSLAELMRAGKPLPPKRVATILTQVLNSLHEAHTMGMLHRDLKPANIMIFEHLGNRDNVKLLDFGIAKLVKDANIDKDLTGDGTLVGTPRYMAPEQIRGDVEPGPSADIYSLGLVAYELLVAERAIEADSSIKIIGRQLSAESFRLPEEADCPPRLRHIINQMIAKDLEVRYDDAQEVIRRLADPDLLDDTVAEIESVDLVLEQVDDLYEEIDLDDPSVEELDPDSLELLRSSYLADPDVSVEEPVPDPIDPSYSGEESLDISFSALHADRRRPIILAGIVFLALVVALLLIVFIGGSEDDTAYGETRDGTTVNGAVEGAKVEVEEGKGDEIAANDASDAGVEDSPVLEFAIEDARPKLTRVMSNFEEVEILIDGESVGAAPVEIDPSRFPARVEARHKGRKQTMFFKSPGPEISFEFPPYQEPEPQPERKKKKKKKPAYEPIPY